MRKEDIIERSPLSDKQQQVLAAYVHRRLYQERAESASFSAEDTRRWLIRLAKQMSTRNQTEFYLDQLQPEKRPAPRFYQIDYLVSEKLFGSRLIASPVEALSWSWRKAAIGLSAALGIELVIGLSFGVFGRGTTVALTKLIK